MSFGKSVKFVREMSRCKSGSKMSNYTNVKMRCRIKSFPILFDVNVKSAQLAKAVSDMFTKSDLNWTKVQIEFDTKLHTNSHM